ncbi:MAG: hypothetical protein M1835_004138, partial [Candelina submexicana]
MRGLEETSGEWDSPLGKEGFDVWDLESQQSAKARATYIAMNKEIEWTAFDEPAGDDQVFRIDVRSPKDLKTHVQGVSHRR